jgi:SAM-dependent methyltransferase
VIPIPTVADREGYYPGDDAGYLKSGEKDYEKIWKLARKGRWLDFGCASGRVLRHNSDHSIFGCDINENHVKWCRDHLKGKFWVQNPFPQIRLSDGSFYIVSAFSVFTHIPDREEEWLEEINRVLVPGGYLYATIHTEDTWYRVWNGNNDGHWMRNFLTENFDIKDKSMEALTKPGRLRFTFGKDYYANHMFYSLEHIKKRWSRLFEIDYFPHASLSQDVLIMRKRSK